MRSELVVASAVGFILALSLTALVAPLGEWFYWRRFEKWSLGRTFDGAHGSLVPEYPR
jgi:hypothetical protein